MPCVMLAVSLRLGATSDATPVPDVEMDRVATSGSGS